MKASILNINNYSITSGFGGFEFYRYGFNGMEKDKEFTKTESHYDFGARIYDSRLGRWLSVDPKQRSYPAVSPFVFALNSTLLFIDPNGEDAVVTVQKDPNGGGKIIISSTIYITGKGANEFNAGEYTKQAKSTYKPGSYTNSKGETFDISFDIKYEYAPDDSKIQLQDGDNILYYNNEKIISYVNSNYTFSVNGKGEFAGDVIRYTGNTGEIGRQDAIGKSSRGTLHETLHFLGLSDRYSEGVDANGYRETTPDKDFEDDMMGTHGAGRSGKQINQIHYDNIGKTYSGKESGVYTLKTTVDTKSSDGSINGGSSEGKRPIKQSK